jgi:hypothetical protein
LEVGQPVTPALPRAFSHRKLLSGDRNQQIATLILERDEESQASNTCGLDQARCGAALQARREILRLRTPTIHPESE